MVAARITYRKAGRRGALWAVLIFLAAITRSAFAGDGTNAFSEPFVVGGGASIPVATGDFDGNGLTDLLAWSGGLAVYRNTSSNSDAVSFERAADVPGDLGSSACVGDLDGDGRPDVLVSASGSIYAARNTSPPNQITSFHLDWQMTNAVVLPPGTPAPVQLADIDGDGRLDALIISGKLQVYPNTSEQGAISFGAPIDLLTNLSPDSASIGDINGDGKPDIYINRGSAGGLIYANTGSPGLFRFGGAVKIAIGTALPWGAIGVDLTGDAKPDWYRITPPALFVTKNPPLAGELSMSRNLSQGTNFNFQPMVEVPLQLLPANSILFPKATATLMLDIDSDGRPDPVLIAEGQLEFQPSRIVDFGEHLTVGLGEPVTASIPQGLSKPRGSALFADFNRDGRLDMALTATNRSLVIVLNQIIPEPVVQLDIPARSRRVRTGEMVDTYGAVFPANSAARLALYRDDELLATYETNRFSAAVLLDKAGIRTVRLDALNASGEVLKSASLQVLVVDQLNIAIHARELPVQSSSRSSYVLDSDGEIYAFGLNNLGQLGTGRYSLFEPVAVKVARPPGVKGWMTMAAGGSSALAIGSDGMVYGWGDNKYGQLGLAGVTNTATPTALTNIAAHSIAKIAVGNRHLLLLATNGDLFGCGNNSLGQLGLGHTNELSGLQKLPPPGAGQVWQDVFAGFESSYAISSDGTLFAWGANSYGELGTGNAEDALSPVPVIFPENDQPVQLAPGNAHALALMKSGKLYEWGLISALGITNLTATNYFVTSPIAAPLQGGWKVISASANSSSAIDSAGALYQWAGTYQPEPPAQVMASNNVTWVSVAEAMFHTLAIGSDGLVYSWGQDSGGELGNGTNNFLYRYSPQVICSLDNVCPDMTNLPPRLTVNYPKVSSIFPEDGRVTLQADAVDPDGLIDRVGLYSVDFVPSTLFIPPYGMGVTNLVASLSGPPYNLPLTNDFNGVLIATDNSGAQTSVPISIKFPRITPLSGAVTSSFTGHAQWSANVSPGTFSFSGFGIVVTNLPAGVRALNAIAVTNGFPLLEYNFTVTANSSIEMTLETDGPVPAGFRPGWAFGRYAAGPLPNITGPLHAIDQLAPRVTDGVQFGFAFSTEPNTSYYVEYSADLTNWVVSPVPLQGTGATYRWADTGPPRTSPPPQTIFSGGKYSRGRFYRVRSNSP